MMLYFAYGSNMERAAMRKRCAAAQAVGPALLRGWRYIIAAGYGTIAPVAGGHVFGVLWRLTPRDLATLKSYENLDSGLYRRVMLTVEVGGRRARALVYMGRKRGRRRPAPGYQERVIASAEDWRLPPRYVEELRRLAPGYRASRPAETGEIG
jgi:cation transport regulator ChaC